MRFSAKEIDLAILLKHRGLKWKPTVGHYVWDLDGLIEAPSPFHDRVYFILDLKHFLRRSKTVDALVQRCCWLPTWEQARELLRLQSVESSTVAARVSAESAIEQGNEREVLYRMIAETLPSGM